MKVDIGIIVNNIHYKPHEQNDGFYTVSRIWQHTEVALPWNVYAYFHNLYTCKCKKYVQTDYWKNKLLAKGLNHIHIALDS